MDVWFIVVVTDGGKVAAGLSRREGEQFDGAWRLLTESEATEIADAWNTAPGESVAQVVEVYRSLLDPKWTVDGPARWDDDARQQLGITYTRTMSDEQAFEQLNEIFSSPEYSVSMLEDAATILRKTGRAPLPNANWPRH